MKYDKDYSCKVILEKYLYSVSKINFYFKKIDKKGKQNSVV